jgi:hypothetical protein
MMDAKIKDEIGKILAELDAAGAFIQPATTEESLRDYLAETLGPSWRHAALQTNAMFGCVVYTATLMKCIGNLQFPLTYVIDRDKQGRFYLAAPSLVAGYE